MGDKPIIRIAVPGDTAEDFMQAAAKQFRGDFFVAIDQPVGKFVRIEAPFLSGDVGVRGDAIAMPAVRNGRKGLVIRLVKLDADSLGIPIQEQTKELSLDEEDDDALNEFEKGQATVASNVSAAVAKSIRSVSSASDRAQPVKLQAPPPEPAKTSQPIPREELDDETREAVDEFSDVSTKASEISDEMAKKLTERSVPPATNVVRRTSEPKLTPADDEADADSKPKDVHAKATAKVDAVDITKLPTLSSLTDDDDDDPALVTKVERPAAYEALIAKTRPVEPKAEKVEKAVAPEKSEPQAAAPAPPQASKAATATLVILILLTIAAAAFFLLYEL